MDTNNELAKYHENPIKKWFNKLFNRFKRKDDVVTKWDLDTEYELNSLFPGSSNIEAKQLLQDLLARNANLLDTLNLKMLDKKFVDLFGKAKIERIVTDSLLQTNLLNLSPDELKTYSYILNYKLIDFNERIANLSTYSCMSINLEQLQSLSDKQKSKAISIILSNSAFPLEDLNDLDDYYYKRRNLCSQIIANPLLVDEEFQKNMTSDDDISAYPFDLLDGMHKLSTIDRIKYAIIEAKYGMSLEKAKILCGAFGKDIDNIEQSEEARIIKELNSILKNDDINSLRQIDLSENEANYEGTINIIPTLRNAYLHKYQESLYQLNEDDYIDTQDNIKIYNVLGKNNDNADFHLVVTSLGGIYSLNHNYHDLKADWDRADSNHTISCSFIGNDFLGVVDDNLLLAFSDIKDNELLRASNEDAGTMDVPFDGFEELQGLTFLTPQNEINSSKLYNELLVERKIEKEGKLSNRTPSFAVFIAETIDDIKDEKNTRWKDTKRLASSLGIPIVVIDGTQCAKLEYAKVQEMLDRFKTEKDIKLIPEIIHKIENNRSAQLGTLKNVRNEIFSNRTVEKILNDIIGTLITSDIKTFNQGIIEIKNVMQNQKDIYDSKDPSTILDDCQSYDYDKYLEKIKTLYYSRNNHTSYSNERAKSKEVQMQESPEEPLEY